MTASGETSNGSVNLAWDFENEVAAMIGSCLGVGETMRRNVVFRLSGMHRFEGDILLSNGCRLLDWNGRVIVEVKLRLRPTFIIRFAEATKDIGGPYADAKKIIVVRHLDESGLDALNKLANDKGVTLLSATKLARAVESVLHKDDLHQNIPTRDDIVKEARNTFNLNKISLILGAGVSCDAKLPGWEGLMRRLLNTDIQRPLTDHDYDCVHEIAGQSALISARLIMTPYCDNSGSSDKGFKDAMHNALYSGNVDYKNSELIKAIVDTVKCDNVESVITLNYDDLVEQGLTAANVPHSSVYDSHMPEVGKKPVYHIHGILSQDRIQEDGIVFTEDSYHTLYKNAYNWRNVELMHALMRNTCFFIGLSMTDPNIRRMLEFIMSEGDEPIRHFVFMQRPLHGRIIAEETRQDFISRQERILASLGVRTIWYDEHSEVPVLLREIIKPLTNNDFEA